MEVDLSAQSIEEILKQDEALLEGHFKLRSGRHSPVYLQCARVLQHPAHARIMAEALAGKLDAEGVDAVVGPATGGIVIAYELARVMGGRGLFAERVDDAFTLRRGFEIEAGERVLVAEDVITTGGAVGEVVELVRSAGGEVAAVAAIVNRSGGNPFDVPFLWLYELDAPVWDAASCPLCKEGAPLVKPGSRPEV